MNLSIKISLHDPQGSVEVLAFAFHSIISGGWFYMGSASDLEKKKSKKINLCTFQNMLIYVNIFKVY